MIMLITLVSVIDARIVNGSCDSSMHEHASFCVHLIKRYVEKRVIRAFSLSGTQNIDLHCADN